MNNQTSLNLPARTRPFLKGLVRGGLLGLVVAQIGCHSNLPPAPTPARTAPALSSTPPLSPGKGRLIVDVTDGPTRVERVTLAAQPATDASGHTRYSLVEQVQTLCDSTPCVVDEVPGNIILRFPTVGNSRSYESELLHISEQPSVYRRTLTYWDSHTSGTYSLGIVSTALGGMAAATGATLLPIGLAKDIGGMTTAGGIALGVGAAITTLGILMIRGNGRRYRPGSSVHFAFGE